MAKDYRKLTKNNKYQIDIEKINEDIRNFYQRPKEQDQPQEQQAIKYPQSVLIQDNYIPDPKVNEKV
jgi:hypothetical protein